MAENNKKIEFIDCYSHGIFNGNIGFIRYWSSKSCLNIGIFLQNLWEQDSKSCKVFLSYGKDEKKQITEIGIKKGKGEGCCILPLQDGKTSDEMALLFEWAPERLGICRIILNQDTEGIILREQADKWEQMMNRYPCFYPFEGQGCYVMLQEGDRGLLPGTCRKIWDSEFYKEAYAKSHHMIVGEYEIEGAKAFYLGVSGIYNEEEQDRAAIAGFMGYEFSGAAGYYLYLLGECL